MKNKQIKFMQGDVIGFSIAKLPDNAKKINNKPVALGEHSGHQHVITGDVELYEDETRTLAKIGKKGAILQHVHENDFKNSDFISLVEIKQADHNPIPLKEGIYEIVIQNAYNPYRKIMEKVID